MAFRFSLEQVLNYRERLEQQARIELARVEGERLREQRRADGFRVMIDEQTEAMARLTPQQRDERWLAENSSRVCGWISPQPLPVCVTGKARRKPPAGNC